MKKHYEDLEFEVVYLMLDDVIITSNCGISDNNEFYEITT